MQVEGGVPSKYVPLEHQGTVDTPNISIAEGGGKRRKLSSSSPKSVEWYRTIIGSNEAALDGPGTADGFTALANQKDVNKNGTADEIYWDAMGQEDL